MAAHLFWEAQDLAQRADVKVAGAMIPEYGELSVGVNCHWRWLWSFPGSLGWCLQGHGSEPLLLWARDGS